MPTWAYFGLWLVAALLVVAFLSARLAQHLRLREVRRQQGLRLLDALERYSEWLEAQRRAPVFVGESNDAASALDEATTIRIGWFPELAPEMGELLGIHARLLHFLSSQSALRLRDPEAWLETEHDGRFLALFRQHHAVLQAVEGRLALLGCLSPAPPAGAVTAGGHYTRERETHEPMDGDGRRPCGGRDPDVPAGP